MLHGAGLIADLPITNSRIEFTSAHRYRLGGIAPWLLNFSLRGCIRIFPRKIIFPLSSMLWISRPLDSPKAQVLAAAIRDSNLKVAPSVLGVLADLLVGRGIEEPMAGCAYVYLSRGLGPVWGFLYGWTSTMVMQPVRVRLSQQAWCVLPRLSSRH